MGMGGLACPDSPASCCNVGTVVSGSDLREGRALDELQILGARGGDRASGREPADPEVVVISSAVPRDNPEVVAARERDLTVLRRAEMLAALMEGSGRGDHRHPRQDDHHLDGGRRAAGRRG
jgi:UDP-N-acetylmuramate--alanine ligase